MENTLFIVTTLAVFAAQTTDANRHPFPANCTCRYNRLPSSCNRIHPDNYPAHNDVFPTNDCLPNVPAKYAIIVDVCVREKLIFFLSTVTECVI